ncbi:MAG: phosphoethanolamine transferase [Bacteroidales bacterium]|nr:phosphoethanolamine transferase [Bacteroidales bacterium]
MKHFKKILRFFKNQQIVFWTFLAMLILPNVMMFFTESTSTIARLTTIVLPLGLYWLAMTFSAKPGKMFWWLFFFIFIDAFQIVLLYLYGESPIAVDMFLNLTTTNPTETTELLSNLLPAVMFVVVIYVSGIIVSILSILNKEKLTPAFRKIQRKIACGVIALGAVLVGVAFTTDKKFVFEDDVFPFNGCYNVLLSIERSKLTLNYDENVKNFTYKASCTHPDSVPEVLVLVIGETVRADNFAIYGYNRPTTPLLSAMGGDVVAYYDAISMSNTTHKSVPLMLTAVGSEDDFEGVYKQKGIITAFKEAGYSTAFYSCQRRNHSVIDFLGCEADDVKYLKDDLGMMEQLSDEALVAELKKKLSTFKGGKLFVILHCYGSHFNYNDRYTREEAFFTPDEIPSASGKYRDNMVNAYDNTIRQTDRVIAGVINSLKALKVNAAMCFVGDHGEDIFDDSRQRFLHSSPIATYYQLRVPFLLWASAEYKAAYPQKWQAIVANQKRPVSSTRVTFHTMLDLGGVATYKFKADAAVSNPAFEEKPRLYVNDHNEYRTMDDCGLKDLDAEQFKAHGLQYP